jgi:hypothetical protein
MIDFKHPYEVAQESQILSNSYSKQQFIDFIEAMTQEQFTFFCKEILLLTEYYDTSCGAFVTDMVDIVERNPEKFWQLKKIDLNRDINFRIIE